MPLQQPWTSLALQTRPLRTAAPHPPVWSPCGCIPSPTDGGAVYYVYEDSVTAHQSYADIVSSISQQGKKVKQVDSATYNFAQFESSSGGTYCAIRTDSTLLYLADSTETVKELLTELGY